MIKINKPPTIPITLRKGGVTRTELDCTEVDGNRDNYLSGVRKLPEKLSNIYGSKPVKKALLGSHRNKCCYCERIRDRVEIDIEHFRPKSAVKQARTAREMFPGYYWLAYDWDNLYLSCKECNISKKGILFPLRVQTRRSRWHSDPNTVANEEPLFIDPGKDDPGRHLRFEEDIPVPRTRKGKVTIEELDLHAKERPQLREARLKAVRDLRFYCKVVEAGIKKPDNPELQENRAEAESILRGRVCTCAEFSLMSRHFIENYFRAIGHVPTFID